LQKPLKIILGADFPKGDRPLLFYALFREITPEKEKTCAMNNCWHIAGSFALNGKTVLMG